MDNLKKLIGEIESLQKIEDKTQKELFSIKDLINKKKFDLSIIIKSTLLKNNDYLLLEKNIKNINNKTNKNECDLECKLKKHYPNQNIINLSLKIIIIYYLIIHLLLIKI